MLADLEGIDGLIVDLDGTVFHGKRVIEGAAEAIAAVKAQGKKVVFLTNRGNLSRRMCRERLLGMGVAAEEEDIVMSCSVAAQFLRERYSRCRIWAFGEQGLKDELQLAGLALAAEPEQAEWLVITLHESLTYKELNDAFRAAHSGARILATNVDRSEPDDNGNATIDVAGMIGAITAATGRSVDIVVGKPSWLMAEAALRALGGIAPERCLVVGDSMETDIALGRMFGMKTALVLTGSTRRGEALFGKHAPDYIWDSLAAAAKPLRLRA